jgi:hypothetical protein
MLQVALDGFKVIINVRYASIIKIGANRINTRSNTKLNSYDNQIEGKNCKDSQKSKRK